MKRILITGEGSYIGTSVGQYLRQFNESRKEQRYQVDTLSLRGDAWEQYDFSPYDAVYHVVGIAHVDVGRITEDEKRRYYRINRDLAVRAAKRAKQQGVKQFIFMSSSNVYGKASMSKSGLITEETEVSPSGYYGDSKVQAENLLRGLEDENFHVAILRSPVIYGKGCKGNYQLLSDIARKLPLFPDISNERSLLYVENLAEFIRLLVESEKGGLFFPQNAEYMTTAQLVQLIRKAHGQKVLLCRWINFFVYIGAAMPGRLGAMVNKAFGSVVIDQKLSRRDIDGYQLYSNEESIFRTEK